jgi:hypothetical protein
LATIILPEGPTVSKVTAQSVTLGLTSIVNLAFSSLALPFLVMPGSSWGLGHLLEVLFWQAVGLVSWPLALSGLVATAALSPGTSAWSAMIIVIAYPLLIGLALVAVLARRPAGLPWLALGLYHLLLLVSFAAVWRQVLGGYSWMVG